MIYYDVNDRFGERSILLIGLTFLLTSSVHAQRVCEIISVASGRVHPYLEQKFIYDSDTTYSICRTDCSMDRVYEKSRLYYVNDVLVGQKSTNYARFIPRTSSWKSFTDKQGGHHVYRKKNGRTVETKDTVLDSLGGTLEVWRVYNTNERTWRESRRYQKEFDQGSTLLVATSGGKPYLRGHQILDSGTETIIGISPGLIYSKRTEVFLTVISYHSNGDTTLKSTLSYRPLGGILRALPSVSTDMTWKFKNGEEGRIQKDSRGVHSVEITKVEEVENKRIITTYRSPLMKTYTNRQMAIKDVHGGLKREEVMDKGGRLRYIATYDKIIGSWRLRSTAYYEYCD